MTEIKIPFSDDMRLSAMSGCKFCTSRNKKYGEVGDTFLLPWDDENDETPFAEFKILAIEKRTLGHVAWFLPLAEGFLSGDLFIWKWNQLHPRRKFDPDQEVWVHWFEQIELVHREMEEDP